MDNRVISSFFKEESMGMARADVVSDHGEYKMVVYDVNGEYVTEKLFPGKSLLYVESAAENWTMGLQVLNG